MSLENTKFFITLGIFQMENLELTKFKVLNDHLSRNKFSVSYIAAWNKCLVSYKDAYTRKPPSYQFTSTPLLFRQRVLIRMSLLGE